MISRPALKYNGGKFRLREWIISHFPEHKTYVETCFGAGSVLLSKERSTVEIANDLDPNIDNFFQSLRDRPKELIRKIEFTPYSESSLKLAFSRIKSQDSIERAWAFYTICWTSLKANDIRKSNIEFRLKGNLLNGGGHNPARLFAEIRHLYQVSKRLRGVTTTMMDAEEVLKYFDSLDTLFYVDLPYLGESRNTKKLYNLELLDIESHTRILNACAQAKGMVIVSHYIHPLYDSILNNWEVVTKDTMSNSFAKGSGRKEKLRTEALYLSPSVSERLHPSLFREVI
ncbi:DNA adenine methylase [Leptospira sp. GIMC2001]|uniref:DNA adenine methylase n=1 Tax=Leptospira sp. GIMC2001 TaxID=1513297 RepID=UPI002349C852|nr:DNA adenine methylase [Leptospira sp. GIMC2001]WCL51444.1 DNA adenine methylase [Leptospira sp. GIMC2001]